MSGRIKWVSRVAHIAEMENTPIILVIKLWIPRHRWKYNVNRDLEGRRCEDDWIHLSKDRDQFLSLVNSLIGL